MTRLVRNSFTAVVIVVCVSIVAVNEMSLLLVEVLVSSRAVLENLVSSQSSQ